MTKNEPYFHPSILGPECITQRNSRLREQRFQLGYANLKEPAEYTRLAEAAKCIFLEWEAIHPALARAKALYHIAEQCELTIEPDHLFLGGENPFFFNLLLPTLLADRFSQFLTKPVEETAGRLQQAMVYAGPCFDGHITPGLEYILGLGLKGIRQRITDFQDSLKSAEKPDREDEIFYQAALIACESITLYVDRYLQAAKRILVSTIDPERVQALSQAISVLERVPEEPANTFHEALQSYWIVYLLVTLEMGGCSPGGGLGLGRMDQYLLPFYVHDIQTGRLSRSDALELLEQFLLCFRHINYFTPHQPFTPGSQTSLGGITPTGQDGFNELTELILEASLRINMPAPYISLRLYHNAPERYWQVAANYIASGLGFPVVNDEVLIPSFLKHGRSLLDARDYICSCCYEHTIPGREAFHPSCCFVNLLFILELALNEGRSILTGESLGLATPSASEFTGFGDLLEAFWHQIHFVLDRLVRSTNRADAAHCENRRYPMMSLFIDDCLSQAKDVCAGGARYNATGCVVGGLPNVVNSLVAIRKLVFEQGIISIEVLIKALRTNFAGYEDLQRKLLAAPKWGNGLDETDQLAGIIADKLYNELAGHRNARGGRWQLGLYSFICNHWMGKVCGASADGRSAGEIVTRNLNPTWGTDWQGPTAVLQSLSQIDFTVAPDGCSLDLRFSLSDFSSPENRQKFTSFLKAFVELGVMEMQISMVDTQTLLDAQQHPEHYPHLLVRVAGYSARFVDLSRDEQNEIIGRTMKTL